jgi:hypothetical protein
MLQKCVAVAEWRNALECRLRCSLDDAVRKSGRGVQIALGLAGENGL